MTEIAARDLHANTADVLGRVEAGEQLIVTRRGRPVARLVPVPARGRTPISRAELARRLTLAQADPGLRRDLDLLDEKTTDNPGPIR